MKKRWGCLCLTAGLLLTGGITAWAEEPDWITESALSVRAEESQPLADDETMQSGEAESLADMQSELDGNSPVKLTDSEKQTGLVVENGIPYVYREDGKLIRNETPLINGKKYYVNGDGIAQSGWLRLGDWQMYFDPETYEAAIGITKLDGKAYLFDKKGVEILRSRNEVIDGKKYWFQPDGSLMSGWCRLGDWEMYYSPETYEGAVGVVSIEGTSYVFDPNGVLIKDATPLIDGKKYYVNSKGAAQSGWLRLADWQMYFDPETYQAATGITTVDGKAYLFDDNGVEILKSRTEVINGKKYWFQPDGSLMSGWCRLGNWVMYFDPETYECRTGVIQIGASRFLFDENGILQSYYYYSEHLETWKPIKDIITVGSSGAEYETITDAVAAAERRFPQIGYSAGNDPFVVILIWPGTYEEGLSLGERSGICFIGGGEAEISSDEPYPTGAVSGYGCNVWENLTFTATGKNAYAYHYEAGAVTFPEAWNKTVFRNCVFQAEKNAGCGVGTGRNYSRVEFYNCQFISQSNKGLYIHNSTLDGSKNAQIILNGCTASGFWLEDAAHIGTERSSTFVLKVQNCQMEKFTFFGGDRGNLALKQLDHIPEESENIRLDPGSLGNTPEGLNHKKES